MSLKVSVLLFILSFIFCKEMRSQNLSFTENKGQVIDYAGNLRPDIFYTANGNGTDVYIRTTGVSYVLNRQLKKESENTLYEFENQNITYRTHRVDMDFEGCNASNTIEQYDRIEGFKNFYYAHCMEGIIQVKSYNTLIHKNIYPNIDIVYKGSKANGLKYDIIVKPGGNPNDIKIRYRGQDNISLKEGTLTVITTLGKLTEYLPKVYQNINGKIVDIDANYYMAMDGGITFELSEYDNSFPLIIDPWISFFGGAQTDNGKTTTVDAWGNCIFSGFTGSSNFPVLGPYQGVLAGGFDAFIAKMSDAGSLIWSTYYGGVSNDQAQGIIADAAGNIYVTGTTASSNFPIGAVGGQNIFLGTYPGTPSAFLVKLDGSGTRLWSTFWGDASGRTAGTGVCTDPNGDVILGGYTGAKNNMATTGVFQTNNAGGPGLAFDAYVAKFSSTGNRIWASYCGGSGNENGGAVDCDAIGNIYITGQTWSSTDFPVSAGAHQALFGGGSNDGFLFKFNSSGQRLWASYYGGSREENQVSTTGCVKVDGNGDVYIAGSTNSNNRIATVGSFQSSKSSPGVNNTDGFLAKFSTAGIRLWGTYLGGKTALTDPHEHPTGLTVDAADNVIITGDTYSKDFPVTPCAFQTVHKGSECIFITTFRADGELICSGLLGTDAYGGDNESDGNNSSTAAYGGYIYTTGYTAGNFPVTPSAYQTDHGGNLYHDAFIAKLCATSCGLFKIDADFIADKTLLCNTGETVNFTLNNTSCDQNGTTYLWSFPGANPSVSTSQNPAGVVYTTAGLHDVKVIITTPCGIDSVIKQAHIRVAPLFNVSVSGDTSICLGQSAQLSAGNASSYIWSTGETTASVLVSPTGNTTYSVTLTDVYGCTKVISHTIIIFSTPPLAAINGPTSVCAGQSVTLSAAGGQSYLWSTGNASQTITVSPSVNTTYSLTAFNQCFENTAQRTLSVNQLPEITFACDTTQGCVPLCITFSNSTPNTQSLVWDFGNGLTNNNQNPAYHCFNQEGKYSVTLVVTDNNGCFNSEVKNNYITVHPNPIAAFEMSSPPLLVNEPVLFYDKSLGAVYWQWLFGDEFNSTSNNQHPAFTYAKNGDYVVQLVVQNQYGCADTTDQRISVFDQITFYVPNTFTPDKDGVNDVFLPVFSGMEVNDFVLYVFDRWGNLIFESHSPSVGWDGRANGGKDIAQMDTYVWKVKLTDVSGKKHQYLGHVNLLR